MVKIYFVAFVILSSFLSVWADDAITLPKGVLHFYNIFTSGTINKMYDDNGNEVGLAASLGASVKATGAGLNVATGNAFPGQAWNSLNPKASPEVTMLRSDLVFEYGLWDTLSYQMCVPFYLSMKSNMNTNSDLDSAIDTLNLSGSPVAGEDKLGGLLANQSSNGTKTGTIGDILLGFKWQFFNNEKLRAAVAIGTYLPTGSVSSPDSTNISTSTVLQTSVFIPGIRTFFDWQLASWMFVNFSTEHQYRFSGDAKQYTVISDTEYAVYGGDFQPGMKNHFEVDFTFHPTILEKLEMDSGLKFTLDITGRGKYSDFDVTSLNLNETPFQREYRVEPYFGLFYHGWKLPAKLTFSHSLSLAGQNINKLTTTSVKAEVFYKF